LQVFLFNRLQSSRDADGALLAKRTSGIESRIVAALLYGGPVPSAPAAGHVPDANDEDDNGDVVGGCPAGGEDVELGALADGADDGLSALERALVGLISDDKDDDCVLQPTWRITYHLDISKITNFDLYHN
jgi:hypothetical protein